MPHPACAEEPLAMRAGHQPRMEEILGFPPSRCGQKASRFRLLQVDAAIVLGAMGEKQASAWITEQGNGVFVCMRMVVAAVDLANALWVMKQQPFRTEPFVDHRIAAVRGCRRRIETIGIVHRRRPFRSIERERTTAAHPVDQLLATPAERTDAGGSEARLVEERHDAP